MRIELHCHSDCSDGKLSPDALAQKALDADLQYFCLTDHDTTAGYERAQGVFGAKALLGVEISCVYRGKTAHLLVYHCGGNWSPIEEVLEEQRAVRQTRAQKIIAKLGKLGISLNTDFIGKKKGSVGRPDIADALIAQGYCTDRRSAFSRWLGDDRPANVVVARLELRDAVVLAHQNGLKTSLAHPHTLAHHVPAIYDELTPLGLDAIEALYGPYETPEREKWIAFARKRDLVCTGGSDFHGVGKVSEVGVEIPAPFDAPLVEWLRLAA